MSEYIKIKDYKHLIGKRARFKNNLKGYCSYLWLKEGVIKQLYQCEPGDLDHIGLSIVFDKGMNNKENGWGLDSCYIQPNSFELLEDMKMGTSHDELIWRIDELKELIKKKDKEIKKGFNLLMEYFDSISDEEKPKVDNDLKRLGL